MKRTRNVLKRTASLLLASVMVLAVSVPSFAATDPAAYSPKANIKVGKTLTSAQTGVWPDTTTFTFKLSAFSYTAGPDVTNAAYTDYNKTNLPMPEAGAANTAAAADAEDGNALTETITISGFDRTSTEASQTLKVTTGNATYTQAGVYTYTLKENVPADDDKESGVTYDETLYYVNVYVTNVLKADGTPLLDAATGLPVVNVSNITAFKTTNGDTDPTAPDFNNVGAADSTTDAKIGITTPDPTSAEPRSIEYPFTNDYATADLVVTKKVTGKMADIEKQFDFTIALKNSHNADDTRTYAYQVWSMGADEEKGGTDDVKVTTTGKSGTVTNNSTFTLKHDEYIVITGLATDEKVTVTETGAADYKTTITTQNGTTAPAGADVTDLTANKTAGEKTISTATDAVNRQDFVNNKEAVTPTGILVENMPFILILCGAGLALVIILRKRSRKEQ